MITLLVKIYNVFQSIRFSFLVEEEAHAQVSKRGRIYCLQKLKWRFDVLHTRKCTLGAPKLQFWPS